MYNLYSWVWSVWPTCVGQPLSSTWVNIPQVKFLRLFNVLALMKNCMSKWHRGEKIWSVWPMCVALTYPSLPTWANTSVRWDTGVPTSYIHFHHCNILHERQPYIYIWREISSWIFFADPCHFFLNFEGWFRGLFQMYDLNGVYHEKADVRGIPKMW